MIDFRLRNERIVEAAADPTTAVVLLDVVLGYGAHPDPGGILALKRGFTDEAGYNLAAAPFVASVCGTAADPQDSSNRGDARQGGVIVAPSNARRPGSLRSSGATRLDGRAMSAMPSAMFRASMP